MTLSEFEIADHEKCGARIRELERQLSELTKALEGAVKVGCSCFGCSCYSVSDSSGHSARCWMPRACAVLGMIEHNPERVTLVPDDPPYTRVYLDGKQRACLPYSEALIYAEGLRVLIARGDKL